MCVSTRCSRGGKCEKARLCEDAIDFNLPKSFVWTSRKNIPPREYWYSDDPKWQQKGPLWTFTKEADWALFKHRAEQTPAWADAAEWKDPGGWPELPADYEAWKASQPPTENGFKFPKVPGQVREYTLSPLHSKFDGWFGRGRVSIVGGSSGAGKTSLICDLLCRQWLLSSVLGHGGAGLRPLVILRIEENSQMRKRLVGTG